MSDGCCTCVDARVPVIFRIEMKFLHSPSVRDYHAGAASPEQDASWLPTPGSVAMRSRRHHPCAIRSLSRKNGDHMVQRLIRGVVLLAVALGVLFGGRAVGVAEPILIGVVVILALFTRRFFRGR